MKSSFLLVLLGAATLPLSASSVVFTDWSGSIAASGGLWSVRAADTLLPAEYLAASFSPTQTATLDSIDTAMALGNDPFYANNITISITEDHGGTPGAVIESIVVGPQLCSEVCSDLYTIDSVLHPLLSAGSTYWITWAAAPPTCNCSAPTNGVWMNDLLTIGNVDQSPDGLVWHSVGADDPPPPGYLPAFDLNGTVATPEPSSAVYLFGGLAGLCLYRRRRA